MMPMNHEAFGNVHQKAPRWLDAALLVAACINMAFLIHYICFGYQHHFHSDAAVANLLAQEIYDTGTFFPRGWHYVNGDLWVVFMHAWILPLLPFFKNGYALHAASGLIGCALMLGGTWCLTGIMQLTLRARLIALMLLAGGMSPAFAENMFGQQAYGTVYFLSAFLLFCAFRFIQANARSRWAWGAVTMLLLILATWGNPQRAAVYYLIPMLAGAFAMAFLPHAGTGQRPGAHRIGLALLALMIMIAALAGALLYGYFLALGHSKLSGPLVLWRDFDAMVANTLSAMHGLLELLVGMPPAGQPVATAMGVVSALRLLAALTIAALTPIVLVRFVTGMHPGRLFVAAAAASSITVSLFLYITSTIAVASDAASIRYVVPGLVLVLLVLAGAIVDGHVTGMRRIAGAVALLVLACSAPFAYETHFASDPAAAGTHSIPGIRLARFLASNNLYYGYATFWNAGRTTVFSQGLVKVRQVELAGRSITPQRHLGSERWYEETAWTGPSFLLLNKTEALAVDLDKLVKLAGQPVAQLAFEDYVILKFDHNLARDFPEWTIAVLHPLRYVASAVTPHQVGTFSSTPPALTAHRGEAGVLRYGPYQQLAPGRYRMRFDIRTEGKGAGDVGDYGSIEVVVGGKILASTRVTISGSQHIIMPFTAVALLQNVEFRIVTSGNGTFTFYQAELFNESIP